MQRRYALGIAVLVIWLSLILPVYAYIYSQSIQTLTQTVLKAKYNPSSYALIGSTTLVSGAVSDLASDNSLYMTFGSYGSSSSANTLLAHEETTTIGGSSYYLLKLVNPDNVSKELRAWADSATRVLWGKFVYQLSGISSVPASTWTVYYRGWKDAVQVVAHADVDVIIRMSNGTIRSTIATNVANSGDFQTTMQVLSGTYSWANYVIVDQTDFLEIDYYAHITTPKSGRSVLLFIDDNTIPVSSSTRVENILFPNEYKSEVEFYGSSNTRPWNQLIWTTDSAWTTASVTVTIQLYNYTAGGYPTSGNGYYSYNSSTANLDETKSQTITSNPTSFRDVNGNWKIKITGIKATASQFNFKLDWLEYYTKG